jgi:hypothetical protein
MAEQDRRSTVCARNLKVEDFVLNIDISLVPFSASKMRRITAFRIFLLIAIASAPHFLPARTRLSGEQACYQRDRQSHFLHRNRDEGRHSRNLAN